MNVKCNFTEINLHLEVRAVLNNFLCLITKVLDFCLRFLL